MPKIKNIIIFLVIAIILVLVYVFYIKPPADTAPLVVTPVNPVVVPGANVLTPNSSITTDFLNLLLSVNNIKLNDAIFSDPTFSTLHDSSITLVQDGTEGRPNPFAPLGSDVVAPPALSIIPAPPISPMSSVPPASNPANTSKSTKP